MTSPRRFWWLVVAILAALGLAACETAFKERSEARRGASVMHYLFPDDATAATMAPADLATLRVPLRIGVAFVPGTGSDATALTEVQQARLLERVVRAFERYPFVAEIKPIPSSYLQPRGGFTDLDRAARLFTVDVIALLSYDQTQFTEKTRSSMWYWTLIGAYLVEGDQYDVHTMIEATVIDVGSRRLLFRGAGSSVQRGGATASNVAESTRAARGAGFDQATEHLIPQLQASLEGFRTRARAGTATGVQLQLPPGYDPAASAPPR